MRSRRFLPVVLATSLALIAACARPDAPGGRADPVHTGDRPAVTPIGAGHRSSGTHHPTRTEPRPAPHKTSTPPEKPTPSTAPSKPSKPPRFGTPASGGGDLAVSRDGQTFTMRFENLEAGVNADPQRRRRSFTRTLPITGGTKNATVVLYFSGYAFTDGHANARLTVGANGTTRTRTFHTDSDVEFVQTVTLKPGSAMQCRLTVELTIETDPVVEDATGYLNISAIDGRLA